MNQDKTLSGRELDRLVATEVMGLSAPERLAPAIHVEGEWSVYEAARATPEGVGPDSGWMCYSGMEPVYIQREGCHCAEGPYLAWSDDEPSDTMLERHSRDEALALQREWNQGARDEHAADVAMWGHHHSCLEVIPRYSKSWDAASLVVEKMREKGFGFALADVRGGGWSTTFLRYREGEGLCEGGADDIATAPEAICLAALKAIRATKPSSSSIGEASTSENQDTTREGHGT